MVTPFCFLLCRYNLSSKSWLTLDPSVNTVTPRYGHSLALHEVRGGRRKRCMTTQREPALYILLSLPSFYMRLWFLQNGASKDDEKRTDDS